MASEHVLDVLVRRHVFDSERPFLDVLDAIFGGISQPDIEALFGKLAASTSYEQFSSLVRQAQGSAGLIRLKRIRELLGRDLNDGPTRLNLHLATRVWLTLESLRRTE